VRRFLFRRTAAALAVVLLVTVVVFLLIHLLPGGPARAILGPRAPQVAIDEFNHANGYDRPLPVQYVIWLSHIVRGDLGYSYKRNAPVTTLIAAALPHTLLLVGVGTILAVLVAIPMGIWQALRRNRAADYTLTGVSLLLYSMPNFWLGIVLIDVFSQKLGWFPPEAPDTSVAQIILHPSGLVLPVLTVALVTIASFSRYVRSSMLEQLAQDYVRTAHGKGLSGRVVAVRHVLRNSLVPVVTLLGLNLPWILGGSLVVESVFNYPGTGLLFWNAAEGQDFPIMLALTLMVAVATVLGSLMADIGYALLDPRVRLSAS
jgi:peptide/nickel transport system permease protein